jgi:5-methyltetrahydrofolate--homocysteine methyltransferase
MNVFCVRKILAATRIGRFTQSLFYLMIRINIVFMRRTTAVFSGFPSDRFLFFDGAMGTMLQRAGLKAGENSDVMNMTAPDAVFDVHRQYVEAGSDIILTNSLGANKRMLAPTGYSATDVTRAAVRAARRAAGTATAVAVALDIGPIGDLMAPYGDMTFEAAYSMFAEQMTVGEAEGADLISIETMSDLAETRAAILAARENTSLPIFATMTFGAGGRTYMGCTPESFAETAAELGVAAFGVNCSLGPDAIFPIVRKMSQVSDIPLIVKPNAGLPNPLTGQYDLTADLFARQMEQFSSLNTRIVGGCCGTNPDYIRALRRVFGEKRPGAAQTRD